MTQLFHISTTRSLRNRAPICKKDEILSPHNLIYSIVWRFCIDHTKKKQSSAIIVALPWNSIFGFHFIAFLLNDFRCVVHGMPVDVYSALFARVLCSAAMAWVCRIIVYLLIFFSLLLLFSSEKFCVWLLSWLVSGLCSYTNRFELMTSK